MRGALLLLLSAALGCGGDNSVLVEGKIRLNDQDVMVAPTEQLLLTFHPAENKDRSFTALVEADGKFRVDGPFGRGIPPGKYHIAAMLNWLDPLSGDFKDKFKERYSPKNTPLVEDISSSNRVLKIDLQVK